MYIGEFVDGLPLNHLKDSWRSRRWMGERKRYGAPWKASLTLGTEWRASHAHPDVPDRIVGLPFRSQHLRFTVAHRSD